MSSDSSPVRSAETAVGFAPFSEARRGPAGDRLHRRLRRVRRLTRLTDSAFRLPGTRIRIGLDSLIGLVPGAGDLATALISLWIVREAARTGLPRRQLGKMLGNVAIDFVGGSVPLVGDVFDVYWKANQRNSRILESHVATRLSAADPRPLS